MRSDRRAAHSLMFKYLQLPVKTALEETKAQETGKIFKIKVNADQPKNVMFSLKSESKK
ncbi:hypothetical protein [Candidatus Methylomicrobium oryzae]|uniref:hypothetical protein n=1 Tax=Candidatus Methylomicrobium oryzae TaxID=2802053 RepID=UPI00192377EC|nr:hypothetical protein [Methylomicrobium sp. RS1]MBL1263803.1 hypothetical protein [Methylomicrobium sp. RS1]